MAQTIESFTQPILTSLATASTLCSKIKNNRHCGSTHTQLDLLETSLSDGPSFISAQCSGLENVAVDEATKKDFEAYTTQLILLCARLESIAHPSNSSHPSHHSHAPNSDQKHHHHNDQHQHEHRSHSPEEKEKEHHHHKHHSNTKPLIFSAFEPLHHHGGKEVEDPHFGEMRGVWEGVRAEIVGTLAGVRGKAGDGKEEIVVKKEEEVKVKDSAGGGVEVVEKVEIKEEEQEVEVVKEEVKHVEVKEETETVIKVEEEHHQLPGQDISPLDSGTESEEVEEKKVLVKLKEVEVKA